MPGEKQTNTRNTQTDTTLGDPLLARNQGNHNPNEDGGSPSQVCVCCQVGCVVVLVFFVTWVFVAYDRTTHEVNQGKTRRLTENDNIDSLPLLSMFSISLLGLAAVIASTKTESIQNFSLGSLFSEKTSKIEVSKHIEQGVSTPPNHKV